ncbi:hypothetical protein UFOVP610_44 [uncultured Caudovirales phage]|uniref:Uncharacterized protein n=1 Tax=uncultured Caudovirales phage TaxID=2100421 RepID=A0A6J5N7K7_9CAUD|nr:hypothetical protein UFOVP610_44 [uncultured Caudovirales phage]
MIPQLKAKLEEFPSSHRSHYCHESFNQAVSILMPVIEFLLNERIKRYGANADIESSDQEILKLLEGGE